MAKVTREELIGMLRKWGTTIMENVSRELDQRMKIEDFQQVLDSADMPDAWKPPGPDSTDLKGKMAELEAKFIETAKHVHELQLHLPHEMGSPGVGSKPDTTPAQTFPMETPKKETFGGNEGDVEMEAGQEEEEEIKHSKMELEALRVMDLKEICRARGLMISGRKADLVERLLMDEPEEDDKYSAEGLKFLKVVDLKKLCREQGISMTGNKPELIEKLVTASAAGKKPQGWGKAEDTPPDPWAGEGKGAGGGKGGACRVDSEKDKNICERKLFDKRVPKLSGEKGEKEFKKWLFDVRKVTKDDPPFHDFLQWLTDLQEEVTVEIMHEKGINMKGA